MMSDEGMALREATRTVDLSVHSLTPEIALLVWEDGAGGERGEQSRAIVGKSPARPPYSHISVAFGSSHRRNIKVLCADATAVRRERICIEQADGSIAAVADAVDDPAGRPVAFAPAELIAGVDAVGRLRIARLVFKIIPGIFRLGDSVAFAAACRRLAAALAPTPPALLPCSRLFGSYRLLVCNADAALGVKLTAVVISRARLRVAPFPPAFAADAREGEASRLFVALQDPEANDPEAIVVVFSDRGMIFRRIGTGNRHVPSAIAWLCGSHSAKDGAWARRYILDCLAHFRGHDVQAAALLRELQVMVPSPHISSMPAPVAAGADLIIGSDAGVFVKGWLADPQALAEAICIERIGSTQRIDIHALIRFPHRPNAAAHRAADRRDGDPPPFATDDIRQFALFVANDGLADANAPCRISLCLRSGTAFTFAEGPSAMLPHLARDAVLAAIPPLFLSRKIIAAWIAPTVAALHEKDQAVAGSAGLSEVIDIGCVPKSPDAAVISPVPDDPLLMRCRAGLFAADPEMHNVEILHILDRAQDQQDVERFLRGVHAAYGIAARLVVVSRPGTAAAALNAGVQASRAPMLVALGGAVLPECPTWLSTLTGHIRRHPNIGVVAARLLREDCAVWNDGFTIGLGNDGLAPDLENDGLGIWDIRSVRAGFPRGFATSRPVRQVASVSPGCIAIPRSVLESCGGFSQRYLSADYSVADLCLSAAAAGFITCLTREPTLFRLDPPGNEYRRSEALNPRAEIDRCLLEQRWRPRLEVAARARGGCPPRSTESARPEGPGAPLADGRAA